MTAARYAAAAVVVAALAMSVPADAASPPTKAPVVRIPFPHDDGSLTPYTFDVGYSLLTLVYDTLLWRDASGVAQPWLAQSVATSADNKRVTLHLGKGVRWQDGLALTSADVAFTVAYVRAHFHPRFTPPLEPILRVDAPDDLTVVLTLSHPAPGLVDAPLADLPILPAHLWRNLPAGATAPAGLPIGSGPYRLVEHMQGASYRFEANAAYFRGAPAVATLEMPIIGDAEKSVMAAESGRADMLPFNLTPQLALRLAGKGNRIARGPSYVGVALLMNVRTAPFDKVAIRQGVAAALDLHHLAAAVDNGVPADRGWIHPSSPWSSPAVSYRSDPSGARQVLGSARLPPVEILAPDNDPTRVAAARQVAFSLRAAGLTAEPTIVTRAMFDTRTGADGSAPNFRLAIGAIPPLSSYDPNFLAEMFGSDPARAPFNTAGYASPAFDRAASQVASVADPAGRQAALAAEQQVLAADVPAVPLFFAAGAFAYRARTYDGWVFVKGSGIFDKRSFVDLRPAAPAPTSVASAVAAPAAGGSGLSPLGIVAALAMAGAAALALFGLLGRRR